MVIRQVNALLHNERLSQEKHRNTDISEDFVFLSTLLGCKTICRIDFAYQNME